MALVIYGCRRHVCFLGLLNCDIHGALIDHVAETPIAINNGRGRAFLHYFKRRAWHDMAAVDPIDIGRNLDDAMRIMTGQIGVDAPEFSNRTSAIFLKRSA